MKLKIIISFLCFLVMTVATLSAISYYSISRREALQQNHFRSMSRLAEAAARIDMLVRMQRQTLTNLTKLDELLTVLKKPTPETIANANQLLTKLQPEYKNSILYLLDSRGDTLASSNYLAPDSFVGHNYAFRPYFKRAMTDMTPSYPAVSVTSGKKVLYLSQPKHDPATDLVIGVIVAKLPLTEFFQKSVLGKARGIITLTSPNAQVFCSTSPGLEDHFLWQTPSSAMMKILNRNKQFGSGPWNWAGFNKISLTKARSPDGKRYTIHRHPLKTIPGWNLTSLHDDQIFAAEMSTRLRNKVIFFLVLTLTLLTLSVVLLYRLAVQEIAKGKGLEYILRRNQHLLEARVDERTTELQTSNMTHKILNSILNLVLEDSTLQEFLDRFMEQTKNLSSLGLLPQGALFMVDENDPGYLQLKAQYGLDQPLLTACARVKFGHCLCGRAAAEGKILFVNGIDDRHDNTYDDIKPHGHYCIPVMASNGQLLGLYNVYTKPGTQHDQQIEDFLVAVSRVLSGIIQFKQSSRKIHDSEENRRAITDMTHDAIIAIDHQGRAAFWNPAATAIFGYSAEEALGQDLHQLIAPEKIIPEAMAAFGRFIKTGEGPLIGNPVEITGLRKDRSEVHIELSLSALPHHSLWAAVGILRDISTRKEAEIERSKLQGQLRQSQKMEAIGTLAGGIAHDFNNILSSILGYAELVRDDLPQDSTTSLNDLDQVIKAGNRARELVKQIMTFSRQTEDEFVPVQVSLIIKEAIKLLRASLPSSIEIHQLISDSTLTVFADPSQIHQVMMNLCTNAFKAMQEKGGTLEIRLESFTPDQSFTQAHPDLHSKRYIVLVAKDTGVGMDSSTISHIFEPYYSTSKKEGGTGLGLSVVHGIVTNLGGIIEVSSIVNSGSTFKVYIPILEDDNLPTPHEQPPMILPRGSEHILLVDDELPILEMLSRMLTRHGYQATSRTSSIEALELFRNKPDEFSLIITDQNMPNMTGIMLADEIMKIRPEIPIVLCTGYSDLNIGQHNMGKSIKEIIMKPTSKDQLLTTIRQVLDGSGT